MPYSLKKKRAQTELAEKTKHYEQMLREMVGDVPAPDKTEEGLLEEQRTGKEADTTTEGLLEAVRTKTVDSITEKRLDTEKPVFGGVMRADSLDGSDVPPLEKARLAAKDVMENEQYERANILPKKTKKKK